MTTEIILIIIAGLLAMVTHILGLKFSGKFVGRLLWGFFILLILASVLGGISLVKERKKLEESYKTKLDYLFKHFYHQIPVGIHATATMTAKARVKHANGQVDLKDRAEDLFLEINKFLIGRESKEPPMPRMVTFEADVDKIISYSQDTMKQYSSKFGPEVVAVRNELANKGKQDKELDNYYRDPSNSNEIRLVAERIRALAGQLP